MFMDDDSIHAFVIDLSHLFSLKCTHLITVTSRSKNGNASDLCLCFRISQSCISQKKPSLATTSIL